MPDSRRKFDPEFREGAVRIVRETGKPIAQVARDLGINAGTLANWCACERAEHEGMEGLSTGDVVELKRLRAEVAELRVERDVLKRSVTHNAEHRIMPRTPLNRLRGKGSVSTRSA
jgi:transposase-like protein